jgi:hypothetical protein
MHDAIAHILDPATRGTHHGFETLRDQFGALPYDALPELLALARDPAHADIHGPAIAALGDLVWPGAYAAFTEWVVGDDTWQALDAGCALDAAGGGGFGYWERVAPGDVPAPQRIRSVGPELVAWWADQGRAKAPDELTWLGARGRTATAEERSYLYVRTTRRAVLSNGWIVDDHRPLPRGAGRHLSGATCLLDGREVRAAVILDSSAEPPIAGVMVESDHGWLNVAARARAIVLDYPLGDETALSDFANARYEIGPTGSVRERKSA